MKNVKYTEIIICLKYVLFGYLCIGSIATIQILIVHDNLKLHFYLIPFIVATIIGVLLGHSAVLKKQLSFKTEQFRAIADMAVEFTYYRNLDGVYEYVSPSCLSVTGYDQSEFYQQPHLMNQLIQADDEGLWLNHVHVINEGASPQSLDFRLLTKDNREIWISHVCTPVYGSNGQQIGVRSTNLDITERKTYEQSFLRMAFYDSLTELPNRRSLELEISNTIGQFKGQGSFALLFLDLSRFKNINDNFGHTFGDRLLSEIAKRLTSLNDELFISRFGGDEFVLLAKNVSSDEQAIILAQGVIKLIEAPMEIDEVELFVSGSIGIAFYPRD
ncbi:MAG: sensor domain-containing diguanylate cyclase, partial [Gammaproteobacteria bacterium]|nr:sensor domain-containing diguanylate cyclase [Gammaproteobacteria bacterium]